MYMAVTADKYELPIAFADKAKELGKLMNVSEAAVYSSITKGKSGRNRGYKFVKVDIE